MPAQSLPRKLVKKFVVPTLSDGMRQNLQALAMVKDILDHSGIDSGEPEVRWIREWVSPGDTVLDIGANYGLYTYHASKAVGKSGRVYAFEPIPYTIATLRKVCRLLRLRNVNFVALGCSDEAATVKFSLPMQSNNTLSAGLAFISVDAEAKSIRRSKAGWERTREVEAQVVRIDDFLPHLNNGSLIKVDIEGADLLALRGARNTIERNRPVIVMEVEPRWYESYGITAEAIVQFFDELNYEIHECVGGELLRTTADAFSGNNRVFLPR